MLAYLARYFSGIPPVFIDGLLYYVIAVSAITATFLGTDEAFEIIPRTSLFYMKWINAAFIGAGLTALKTFRSTAYSEHQEAKAADRAAKF